MSRRSAHHELLVLGGLAALTLGAIGAAAAAPSPVGVAAAVALAVQAGHAGRRARTGTPIPPRALAFAIAVALLGLGNGGLGDAMELPPWRALAALAAYPLLGRDAVVSALEELRSLGIRAAIDDFGTGYCGLRYLGTLPVDYLKIDKSFVQAMTPSAAAIVAATIAMGHSLGLGLVAEGVETEEQRRFLKDRGCDHFQGFLVGRPMPADDLADRIRAQRALGDAAGDASVHEVDALGLEPALLRAAIGRG